MSHALRLSVHFLLTLTVLISLRTTAAEPVLNGVSVYSELGSEQFIAGLYTSRTSSESKSILLDTNDQRMEVRVLANSLLGNRFKRMWIEGVAINAGTEEMAKNSQFLADFSNMLALKLQRDDILSISRAGNTTIIRVNNLELGRIPSGDFYNLLLRTWIGPVPLSSGFRDGLLTAGKVDEKTISIYSKINPTPERIAVIRAAIIATGKNKGKPLEVAAKTEPAKPETAVKPETPAKPDPAVAKAEPVKPPEATAKTEPAVKPEAVAKVEPGKPSTAPTTETAKIEPAKTQQPPAKVEAPAAAAATTAQIAKASTAVAPSKPNEVFEDDDKQETADSLLVQQLYISKLSKRTASFVKYPKTALSKEQEGTVRLSITINRSGEVVNVSSSSQKEIAALTEAAVSAVRKASPYPAIPEQMKNDSFTFTVPVTFRVK